MFSVRVDGSRVELQGQLDLATVAELELALSRMAAGGGEITLDVRGLEFIDSQGVHAIVAFANERKDNVIAIEGASEQLRRALDILGLEDVPNLRISDGAD
jgi:anti-anti-sigma factor